MNSWECWWCKKLFSYEDPKYRDVTCPECGTMNSIYNPADQLPYVPNGTEGEEEMALNYQDEKYQGKFVYLPKVGESAEFDIKELREVKSDNPKFNFSENVPVLINGEPAIDDEGEALTKKKDLGYHIEAELQNGKILSITSMSAFIQVFKKNEIQDGDRIKISHPDTGKWEVEKL